MLTRELEERVWYPLWTTQSGYCSQDSNVGFFSPKTEAYRPLGKLTAVRPLLTDITQRFPRTFRGVRMDANNPTPSPSIRLKPESRRDQIRPLLSVQRSLPCRDLTRQVLHQAVKRSGQRVQGSKWGKSPHLPLTPLNIREVLAGTQSVPASPTHVDPSLVLKQEHERALAEKLEFYDESRRV